VSHLVRVKSPDLKVFRHTWKNNLGQTRYKTDSGEATRTMVYIKKGMFYSRSKPSASHSDGFALEERYRDNQWIRTIYELRVPTFVH